ncbi:hypothetical protein llap_465 [Limosa lapponica baueri]|uniref:Uncharacterized protein n=1 Tax=Limosa lapponica baueri TaxID=1758121 RepID=A0A2I0UTD1_LIMLA|nr:hypothetical protein llap_465 [Limosa lapponica baueri]
MASLLLRQPVISRSSPECVSDTVIHSTAPLTPTQSCRDALDSLLLATSALLVNKKQHHRWLQQMKSRGPVSSNKFPWSSTPMPDFLSLQKPVTSTAQNLMPLLISHRIARKEEIVLDSTNGSCPITVEGSHGDLPLTGCHSPGVPQPYSDDDDARDVQLAQDGDWGKKTEVTRGNHEEPQVNSECPYALSVPLAVCDAPQNHNGKLV